MPISTLHQGVFAGASGAGKYVVDNSAMFNDGDSEYLNKSFGSPSSASQFGYAFWVKLGSGYNGGYILSADGGGNNDNFYFSSEKVNIQEGGVNRLVTTQVFRDFNAWYHFVVAYDLGNSTNAEKLRLYVNGTEVTAFDTDARSGLSGTSSRLNANGKSHDIGANVNNGVSTHVNPFDGYIAEFVFIDGSVITPSMFGEFDTNGIWKPKDVTGLTFGNNGFYLDFETAGSDLGDDKSGRGNDFSNNNSVSQSSESPTSNCPTFNPLDYVSNAGTLSEGNTKFATGGNDSLMALTQTVIESGCYWEAKVTSAGDEMFGLWANSTKPLRAASTSSPHTDAAAFVIRIAGNGLYVAGSDAGFTSAGISTNDVLMFAYKDGQLFYGKNGSWENSANPENETGELFTISNSSSRVIQIVFGRAGGSNVTYEIKMKEDEWTHTAQKPTWAVAINAANAFTASAPTIQDGSAYFQTTLYTGNVSGQSIDQSENSTFQPDWVWIKNRTGTAASNNVYDALRGVNKSLKTNTADAELTTRTDLLTSFDSDGFTLGADADQEFCNKNSDTYAAWQWRAGGTSPTKTYTVKVVSDSGNKYRFDDFGTSAVTLDLQEGGTYTFNLNDSSNDTHPFNIGTSANANVYGSGILYYLDGVSVTNSAYISGFTAATTRKIIFTVPASAPTLYYFCSSHSGMGGQINTNDTFGSSNFAGSLQSKVTSNTTAGFSIVSWSGNKTNATIGHELGVAPKWILTKALNATNNWRVYHAANTGSPETDYLVLDSDVATSDEATIWNDTAPTSTVFSVGTDGGSNENAGGTHSTNNMIAYCWSEVEGFSKFGAYTGNNSTDGPFVELGFKPAWIMIKAISAVESWWIGDNVRNGYNDLNRPMLAADLTAVENTSWSNNAPWDALSNGFKIRRQGGAFNTNGSEYLYMAFAEHPFAGSTPVTAR